MSTIKGSGLRSSRAWLVAELGSDFQRFLATCPPETADLLGARHILAGAKYPRERLHDIFEAVEKEWPSALQAKLHALGAHIGQEDLGGVYSVFLKLGSVDGTLRILARVWGRYFDQGRAALIDTTPYLYTFEVVDPSLHRLHPHVIAGYVRRAVELAGGKAVSVEHMRGTAAHQHLFRVRWKP
jgi:hypothetical protein